MLARRRTARLLILDPLDRLLLIQYQAARDIDPARPGDRAFWYLPGGGLEPGENHIEAARRELSEETGITDVVIGAHIANWNGPVTLFRKSSFTEAQFYVVRTKNDWFDASQLAITENDPVLDIRWWRLEAFAASGEIIAPMGVLELAKATIAGDFPASPVEIICPFSSHPI